MTTAEQEKIGVYVCHCGTNIAGVVDVKQVAEWAAEKLGHRGVVIAREYKFMCSSPGQELIEKDINRLLVTDKGETIGVIASSDFVASIAKAERIERDTVADVMSDAILVCRDKTPVSSAARAMTTARYRSVLVVNSTGRPLGVASEKDLMPLLKETGFDDKLTVAEVMHPILAVDVHASLRDAVDVMIRNHHHRVVVIDRSDPDSFPLGMVSSFDIVAEMARPGSVWQS